MSRAAMLPMPGDPFILNHFLSNFENIWRDEVDQLYILLNMDARMPKDIIEKAKDIAVGRDKVTVMFVNNMLFQGAALRYMLPQVKEDLILSIEDDTVIIKKGQIDKCFRKIESGEADVIGSPRCVSHPQILEACRVKFNLDYSGYGDRGPTYWPNFFFCRKADLLKTDLHFEPKGFNKGEYIAELNITAEDDLANDVFAWLCIQLRAMGLKFYDVPQCHSHPEDFEDITEGRGIGDGNCPWIHIGSLTMTAEDLLMGIGDPKTHRNKPRSEMEKKEMERRYAWLLLFTEESANKEEYLRNLKEVYVKRMNEYIMAFDLSVKRIDELVKAYRRYISW